MVLLRELLRGELVQFGHLPRQIFGLQKSLRKQHNLRNQRIIRHHHSNRPKQRFQVIWQLRPPRISRIHRDEGRNIRIEVNCPAKKLKLRLIL